MTSRNINICYSYVICLILIGCRTPVDRTGEIIEYRRPLSDHETLNDYFGEHLKLTDIRNSKTGFALRIWFWNGLGEDTTCYVVDFSGDKRKPNTEVFRFVSVFIDTIWKLKIIKHWPQAQCCRQDKSGMHGIEFERFLSFMKAARKEEYPHEMVTGLGHVEAEVREPVYQLLSAIEPSFYRNVDTGSRRLNEFLKRLAIHLEVPFYQPYEVDHFQSYGPQHDSQ